MADPTAKPSDAQSLPDNAAGQPMPRRTSPDKSVTLQHHRLVRDASLRNAASMRSAQSSQIPTISIHKDVDTSPTRGSSGESQDTTQSDAMRWFDRSNENPTAAYTQGMDVDPPFYQKESDSSIEDGGNKATYPFHLKPGASHSLRPPVARSSSTGDYRSVIDDLTVEIQKLKDELKKYKQSGPDLLKRDKLFEIKVHGLPKRKKRELEATLRDFASGLSESASAETSSARKKSSRNHDKMYSASGSMSKHASSSSGSNWKHADSAYASASTGPNTSGTSLTRPSMSSRARSSEQKVESYLKDIPEGLYPRHMVMTDKEKKKLVVRRLEHLFTGKITGQAFRENGAVLAAKSSEVTTGQGSMVHQPPSLAHPEASREARIAEEPSKKSRSRDNDSTENSNGDQNEATGNAAVARTSNSVSPPDATPAEQRATRPLDLDPHRKQVPSENMDYIRHLGLVPPELLPVHEVQDVASDADGWVYLNLLCSLAQLHIVNVTPDFIRTAVTEKSTKFQLSHDGRKIRWRGGSDGTRFSSDSSGDGSRQSPSFEDTDGSNEEEPRKKLKKVQVAGEVDPSLAHSSSKHNPTLLGKTSVSPDNFHYKPMFVHQSTSGGQSSMDDTSSSVGPVEDSNLDDSRWGNSGSGTSLRKKRRRDGAIIYYNGAPFCTDLSGDPGDTSPTSHMASSGQQKSSSGPEFVRPDPPQRTTSGSALRFRPLSDNIRAVTVAIRAEPEATVPYLTTDDSDDSEMEESFLWSDSQQFLTIQQLEPSGLGGVVPEDHFMVVCGTKRPKANTLPVQREMSDTFAKYVVNRISAQVSANPLQKAAPALVKPPLMRSTMSPAASNASRLCRCRLRAVSSHPSAQIPKAVSTTLVLPMKRVASPTMATSPDQLIPAQTYQGLCFTKHRFGARAAAPSLLAGTARGRSKSTDLPDPADSSNATVDAESGYKSSSECS
ncbi:frequency clock protein [Verticillium alfalfae VaMs.102]|uniref:Frequency clock protein n=1 Tax=Verticillium alfalfae (strain VaMs.102 / ATCC MYA-4576 / FGSC 10136) TaxID=526221 RepID=C9SGJ5_VERA1|nr:frequency clock protein [Verticillium alfalfae VaMs.102]EEY17512.1 frequency clock protein [Verticillium alfalfae VaMs.102]